MALAIDASTPALVLAQNAGGAPATTASFAPPLTQTVLVAVVMSNAAASTNPAITLTNSGSALTWTEQVRRAFGDTGAQDGATIIYTAPLDSSRSLTVSVSNDQTGDFGAVGLAVYVVTGANTASPVGATGEGSSTTSNITPTLVTTTADGSWTIGGASDWVGSGIPTSSDTGSGFNDATSGVLSGIAVRKSAASSGVGTSVTLNFNGGAGSRQWNYAAVEVLPASVSGGGYQPLSPVPPPLLYYLAAADQAMWQTTVSGPQTFSQSFDGSVSPTGALANLVTKPGFAGTVGPTGSLAKRANKALAGTLTSAGSLTRATLKALAGTATSAGALAKAVTKPGLAGSSTPAGGLAKQVNKALSGVLTSSGALTTVKVVLRSFAGTLTSSGTLAKQANKALSGSASSAGALTRQAAKALAGTATSSGALAKAVAKKLAGTIASSGALSTVKVVIRSFAGTLTSSGALSRQAQKALAGTVASSGSLKRAAAKALAGAATSAGALAKLVAKPLAGSAALSGLVQIVKGVFGLPGFLFPSTRSGSATSMTKSPGIGESTAAGRIGSATSSAHLDSTTDGGQA